MVSTSINKAAFLSFLQVIYNPRNVPTKGSVRAPIAIIKTTISEICMSYARRVVNRERAKRAKLVKLESKSLSKINN